MAKRILVSGPPCAGKTTYALETKAGGDIVIDVDRLTHALSGSYPHERKGRLFDRSFGLYDKAVADSATDDGDGVDWVVACYPKAADREKFCADHEAECILLLPTEEECKSRLEDDGTRPEWLKATLRSAIEQWFADYTPSPDDQVIERAWKRQRNNRVNILRRTIPVEVTQLGEREVNIRMSTGGRARDGHILEPSGCDLTNYRNNPIVLWSHDPTEPIGNNEDIAADDIGISARCVFAQAGISHVADRICGLVKTAVVRSVSIGFVILEGDPIDPARPRAGIRATKWELLECSFVSVPSDTGAVVTGRAAANEDSSMPQSAPERAQLRQRLLTMDTAPKLRGLYDVAQLAYLLQQLGYAKDSAEWEKNLEGDDSQVPAMLGDCLISLGNSLIAMTKEEVGELLADTLAAKAIDDEMAPGERSFLAEAPTDFARAWRAAQIHVRAGKAISAATAAKLADATGHLDRAAKAAVDAAGNLDDATAHQEAAGDAQAKAQAAHGKMGDAIEAASGSAPADVAAQLAKVQQHHKTVGKHLATIGERCAAIGDVQADAQGSIASAQRCLRSAVRCVRGITDADGDTDSQDIQTSAGDGDSDGSKNDRADHDYRKRQALLMELAAA